MKIAVNLESFGVGFRLALQQSAQIGATGVTFDAIGELSPEKLTDTGRREIRNLLKTYNLTLAAIGCSLRRGIDVAENQQPRIEYIQKVMDLAFDLGPRIVVVPFPRIPATDEISDRANRLAEAVDSMGRYGDRIGTSVALEVGLDPAEKVMGYLNRFEVGSLGIHFDPANHLFHQLDPIQELTPYTGRILHIQARDARTTTVSRGPMEVPLGAGDIPWMNLIAVLGATEYRGYVTVKRESSDHRLAEIQQGVAFLKRFVLNPLN